MPPARKAAVLTCMDARLHPEGFLRLEIVTRTSSAGHVYDVDTGGLTAVATDTD